MKVFLLILLYYKLYSIIHSLEYNKGFVALVPYNCNCIFSTSLELSKVT
ncbi:hypothetical protein [Campylobacter phage CJLB-12]|nr:hypothetical protein [Campylobacter phage CJLB-12]